MEVVSHVCLLVESQAGSGEPGTNSSFTISEWCELGVPQELETLWHRRGVAQDRLGAQGPELSVHKAIPVILSSVTT